MRGTLALLCLYAVAGAQQRASLETKTERDTYYVQEPFRITLRIGIDGDYFEKHVVQMFQRELDVPIHIQAPWLEELAGAIIREQVDPPGRSFALNDAVVEARETNGGIEIERTYIATRPGELVMAAPRLRYSYGTRFKEDFIHGRIAEDRRDAFVDGTPLTLRILPLPEEGRPPKFTGAVGRFTVRAHVTPGSDAVGSTMRLTLHIEGDGNLDLFDAPRLDVPGLHVLGMLDDKAAPQRTITYHLVPSEMLTEVPAIPFSFFDPRARAYRTALTEPIPLEARSIVEPVSGEETSGSHSFFWIVGAALACFALWLRLRKRKSVPGPAEAFRERARSDLAAAFTGYLATRLRCSTASVIAPDLPARLTAAGMPTELAKRVATLLERLIATRYGGTLSGDAMAEARELVDALEVTAR